MSRSGEGALVDVPMIDGQVALLTYHASGLLNAGVAPSRLGNHHPSIHPYGTYKASDGHITIAVGNDKLFEAFARCAGHPEWSSDARFSKNAQRVANRSILDERIEGVLLGRSVDDWCAAFLDAGVPAGPINSVQDAVAMVDLVEHDHPNGVGTVRTAPLPYRIDGAPRAAALPPPPLGAHSAAVFAEWLGNE